MPYILACSVVLLVYSIVSVNGIGPLSFGVGVGTAKCEPSLTTASGPYATHKANGQYCSGDLIFEDTFDVFDLRKWQHENTLSGNGKLEFQWYTNNRSNSFCDEGFLNLRPTLTADVYGETFLSTGTLSIHGSHPVEQCTNPSFLGCERVGTSPSILNPVRSAKIRTIDSFAFKYGKVEISAKMPTGDWLHPALLFLPKDNTYGGWPSSGEIDLILSRGNRNYTNAEGKHIGVEQFESSIHYGPFASMDQASQFVRNSKPGNGFNNDFHRYQMEWTPDKILFSVDDVETGTIKAATGFWSRSSFDTIAPGIANPWRSSTTNMAPFDQEFYLIMNLAIGGNVIFPDDATNAPAKKPWLNNSPTSIADFWNARNSWLPTWNLEQNLSRDASLIVDYVRIWAL